VITGERKDTLPTSALARSAGVSPDTLRHYENKGLIPRVPRQPNGYRLYPIATLERVHLIRAALTIGFTLDELSDILQMHDRGGAPCQKVRQLAARKLETIEARLQELAALRDELRETLRAWDQRLAKAPVAGRYGLLQNLRPHVTTKPAGRPLFTVDRPKEKTPPKKKT
jgi:MerR family transcriptional regulator, Zn(II)-responsive regulator of zntA